MKNRFASRILAAFAAASLAACGATDNGSIDNPPAAQQKAAQRSTKQSAASYENAVQSLYVAYFGRPADPGGLANFSAALLAAGAPTDVTGLATAYTINPAVRSLIDSFGTSKESQTLYGSGSTGDFVTAVFQNVLGRAPQSTGLTYWTFAIDSGALSKGNAALAIMAGALVNTTAQGQLDAQFINTHLAVAASFTAMVTEQGATSAYAGATAAASARGMLSSVTASTDLVAFQTTMGDTIGGLAGPSIELLAGSSGGSGYIDGYADQARFGELVSAAPDNAGNVYIGDGYSNTMRKLANGMVSTVAGVQSYPGQGGDADGKGAAATLTSPESMVVDAKGNVYFASYASIRMMTPDGTVTTIAGNDRQAGYLDGKGGAAQLKWPQGLAVDANGTVYFSDVGNNVVRKMTPDGTVTSIAGEAGVIGHADGSAIFATFDDPGEVAVDSAGNVFVADTGNNLIRKITPQGIVSTFAGTFGVRKSADGTGTSATFAAPFGLAIDSAGNLYVGDGGLIRKITPQGTVTTIAGDINATGVRNVTDGTGAQASFYSLGELHIDSAGNLYAGDGDAVRLITPAGVVSTIAGKAPSLVTTVGSGSEAGFMGPVGLGVDAAGNVYVADNAAYAVRKITPDGYASILVGSAAENQYTDPDLLANPFVPLALTVNSAGTLFVASNLKINTVSPDGTVGLTAGWYPGSVDGTGLNASLYGAAGMIGDAQGNIYFTDSQAHNVRMMTPGGTVTTIKDGLGPVSINSPAGIAVDKAGNLYIASSTDNTVVKVTPGVSSTVLAGKPGVVGASDGAGQAALFNHPVGVAMDASGNLYVSDFGNCSIRKIAPDGTVSTVIGVPGKIGIKLGPLPGQISFPRALAFDANGILYAVSDTGILKIRLH